MNEQNLEQKAMEANDLAHKTMDMLRDLNPDPRVAIVSLLTVCSQIAMGMGMSKENASKGFSETWDVVHKQNEEEMH